MLNRNPAKADLPSPKRRKVSPARDNGPEITCHAPEASLLEQMLSFFVHDNKFQSRRGKCLPSVYPHGPVSNSLLNHLPVK